MSQAPATAAPGCIQLGPRALIHLRTSLERVSGAHAATLLREAGFASGEAMYAAFAALAAERFGVERPQALDAHHLGLAMQQFWMATGWGAAGLTTMGPGVMAIDADQWAESAPGHEEYPSCHFSSGMLADIFTRLGGVQAAVMEVECRSRGDARCRFLVSSPALLTALYQRMTRGEGYQAAVFALS